MDPKQGPWTKKKCSSFPGTRREPLLDSIVSSFSSTPSSSSPDALFFLRSAPPPPTAPPCLPRAEPHSAAASGAALCPALHRAVASGRSPAPSSSHLLPSPPAGAAAPSSSHPLPPLPRASLPAATRSRGGRCPPDAVRCRP
ncbi:hypothetical protein BRADI_3g42416v3 [Brachypodium distachyon]|uniref:Uncharacterized protein n=1 Tax=Brachypodium distachyon TaxID=15368 RepID=A0A2K2D2Q0_BRADI|nr:hypothetical protein BRADI_3g42416v3 [Brachypodium distachyon]